MGCVSSKGTAAFTGAAPHASTPAGQDKGVQEKVFGKEWRRGKKLGAGAYAVVYLCTHKVTKLRAAVKVIERSKLTSLTEAYLRREVSIMESMDHPHIVRLIDFYEDPATFNIVIELCEGGELFEKIVEKTVYTEKEAQDLCRIFFDALVYCHERGIVHRDLKPQNLLLVSETCVATCKVADFGFAAVVPDQRKLSARVGSPNYIAPEMVEGEAYGPSVDLWAAGVILYIMLGGTYPFRAEKREVLFERIRKGQYNFALETFKDVSEEAKDLISKLLVIDPSKRLTAQEALQHPWFGESDAVLKSHDLSHTLDELRRFNARLKWRGAAHAVMVANRLMGLGSRNATEETTGRLEEEDEIDDEFKLDEWAEAHTEARTNFKW